MRFVFKELRAVRNETETHSSKYGLPSVCNLLTTPSVDPLMNGPLRYKFRK